MTQKKSQDITQLKAELKLVQEISGKINIYTDENKEGSASLNIFIHKDQNPNIQVREPINNGDSTFRIQ